MHKIIALWAHPRSMSTATERIMRERGDLDCAHEPFLYYRYVEMGLRHFPGFDADPDHPVSYEAIRDNLLARAERGPVFFKDMAYYVMPRILQDPAFMARLSHCFLVREPMAAILSYHKLDPEITCEEIGIAAQWALFEGLDAAGQRPVVLEAGLLRAQTRPLMARFWQEIGLEYREGAFSWGEETPRDWQSVAAWHEAVRASSGIAQAPPDEAGATRRAFERLCESAPHLRDYLRHHQPYYDKLAARALRV